MSLLKTNQVQTTANKVILNSTGSILQVVGSQTVTNASTTGTAFVASGISAAITPTSSTSKILIITHFWTATQGNNVHNWVTIYRGGTNIGSAGITGAMGNIYGSPGSECTQTLTYLDSPGTTSPTTYEVYFKSATAGIFVNIGGTRLSHMTLMEVVA
jgi:hypothetical protein